MRSQLLLADNRHWLRIKGWVGVLFTVLGVIVMSLRVGSLKGISRKKNLASGASHVKLGVGWCTMLFQVYREFKFQFYLANLI